MNGNFDRQRRCGSPRGALILIGVGVVFLLGESGIIPTRTFWHLWPLILIFAGITRLFERPAQKTAALVLCGLGVIFLASEFRLLPFQASRLWPLILIGVGLVALVQSRKRPQSGDYVSRQGQPHFTIFGGVEKRISEDNFGGTDITAIFGGYNIDLRKSHITAEAAVVSATAVFAGIEIRVPEDWNIVTKGTAIFGGYVDETAHTDARVGSPRLIVEGYALFGGVTIKN